MADDSKATLKDGKLVHSKVTQKNYAKIEKGVLTSVNAILLHQTDAPTAASSFNSYEAGKNGAHFLIAKDGTIYQTARVNQKTYHVGKIKSRCYETKSCTKEELKKVEGILFAKKQSYGLRVKNLHKHEKTKSYPERYPANIDSIGIEIVGDADAKTEKYEAVNKQQNASLKWLLGQLMTLLELAGDDVYTHPTVSYKQESEASTATWD